MSQEKLLKPMSVARDEFITGLTDLINNSMLPPFIIEDVLKDTYSKICIISKKQLEQDRRKYYSSTSNSSESNTN